MTFYAEEKLKFDFARSPQLNQLDTTLGQIVKNLALSF